jgi:hypothetical protein
MKPENYSNNFIMLIELIRSRFQGRKPASGEKEAQFSARTAGSGWGGSGYLNTSKDDYNQCHKLYEIAGNHISLILFFSELKG